MVKSCFSNHKGRCYSPVYTNTCFFSHFYIIYFFSKGKKSLPTWDKKIEDLCLHTDRIIELISADPTSREWMNKYLDNQMSL